MYFSKSSLRHEAAKAQNEQKGSMGMKIEEPPAGCPRNRKE
jgi:hypothetical protein